VEYEKLVHRVTKVNLEHMTKAKILQEEERLKKQRVKQILTKFEKLDRKNE
jgi:hypothetical protein